MQQTYRFIGKAFHRLAIAGGAIALTLVFFLVLPLLQTISRPPSTDLIVQTLDIANLPPPPPVEEEPEEEEEEEDEQKPELMEEAPPLDLSQLELALNPGFGEGFGADVAVKIGAAASDEKEVESLFSMSDLDQQPRVIYQPGPVLSAQVRKKTPGEVSIIFVVDQRGRVENPIVQSSTDPVFEGPALAAVRQWKFEPGKRNGEPVRFRMRVPVRFPKGL